MTTEGKMLSISASIQGDQGNLSMAVQYIIFDISIFLALFIIQTFGLRHFTLTVFFNFLGNNRNPCKLGQIGGNSLKFTYIRTDLYRFDRFM